MPQFGGNNAAYLPVTGLMTKTFKIAAPSEGYHSSQARLLGIFYIPANFVGGALGLYYEGNWHGQSNFMEQGPHAQPPRRF
jgi:hypothetical protein